MPERLSEERLVKRWYLPVKIMKKTKIKLQKRIKRHRKIRAKISGNSKIPRLCVFRSNLHIYAQLIDDEKSKIILVASDKEIGKKTKKEEAITEKSGEKKQLSGKVAIAYMVGKLIAEKATKNKIEKVVFDKGGYTYHGRIRAVADGAREGGLKF